ncbi:MAG TPA: hypothetical protein VHW23_47975 [Kofleriaceae bacterium]|jgi:hypothetical protein|nr:hypothetical protein [Kofleriaceae bacterium]
MLRDDYILRMVQQLADAIARIAGLNQRGEHDQALTEADRAWGELLGDIPIELAGSVDSRTLAGLLRQPARIRLAHQLVHEQARALAARGDPAGATRRARRALELLLEARTADAGKPAGAQANPAADAAAIRALLVLAPRDTLAARYQALLPPDA